MQFEQLKTLALEAINDLKGENIVELDVRDKTSVMDLMIVASGTSSRHVKSIANNIVADAKKAGVIILGQEGEDQGEWVLVDLGDIVVHVMQPHIREHYDLEKLWNFGDEAQQSHSG